MSDTSLEVIATGRPSDGSSKLTIFSVRAEEMRSMKQNRKLSASEAGKLAGCTGWPVAALLDVVAESLDGALDPATVGVFTASDGLETEPISLGDLVHGIIVHSSPEGPLNTGGAMRLWFPTGKAVQRSQCGSFGPVSVKGVIQLSLSVEPAPPPAVVEPASIEVSLWNSTPLPLRLLGLCGALALIAVPLAVRKRRS